MSDKLVRYNQNWPSLPSRDEFFTPISIWADQLFDELFPALDSGFFGRGSYPKVNVEEEGNKLILTAEIPGLTKEQVKVELNDGVLSIKGEKKEEIEDKKKKYLHRELKHSAFVRSFVVGDSVKQEDVDAKFENGVLRITLPKIDPIPKPAPKQIEVK
jgi:HSP20 family protein